MVMDDTEVIDVCHSIGNLFKKTKHKVKNQDQKLMVCHKVVKKVHFFSKYTQMRTMFVFVFEYF